MRVREARLSDFRGILSLCMAYLESVCNPRKDFVAIDIAEHIDKPGRFFFVLEDEGTIYGVFYGQLDYNVFNGESFTKERLIYIHPPYRSLEVFTNFIDLFHKWTKEKGCEFTRFLALGSDNNEALARLMRTKFGYEQIGFVLQRKHE